MAILAGGAGSGGGSGAGGGAGDGSAGAGTGGGGENATADARGAPDYNKYPECGYASHPVDVVTGRAFTHPIADLSLPGPLPLEIKRMYSSKMAHRDMGMGYGWGHTCGWEIEVRRSQIIVWNEQGIAVEGGAAMTAAYREDGHLLARTDAMGATTRFDRDLRGRVLQITDPLGRVTKIQRDAAGLPIEVTDPAGGATVILRNPHGDIEQLKDAAGAVTSIQRDERGLITEITWPSGYKTTFAHDEQGNLTLITLPNGATWRYQVDALGRRLAEIDPRGAETRYAYSARGDLIATHDPAGSVTRYGYDGEAHLTKIVDPNGGVTELSWGGYHKLCARKDANGNEVRLRYNLEGELVEVHNERGEVHRLDHDPAGRLIGEITFDGREVRYRHDLCGRVIRIESGRPSKKTHLHYDPAGQLIKRELWDDSVEAFEYNPRGELIAAHWPSGEVRFERDPVGRIVREVQVAGPDERHVEVAYDVEGQRIERRTSLGHVEAIERDAIGARRRTTLDGAHVVEHQSDPWGREMARVLPGGGRIESAYDLMGRLAERRALGPTIHRPVGPGEPDWIGLRSENITVAKSYRYDPAGELIRVPNHEAIPHCPDPAAPHSRGVVHHIKQFV